MFEASERTTHWDTAYRDNSQHSWDEPVPTTSLAMLDAAQLSAVDSIIDVGGGTSRLVDCLLARGSRDVAVLDISDEALAATRSRLGSRAPAVRWIAADLLGWLPERHWDLWHDRAVFHFLTTPADRARYREVVLQATRPGSRIIIGTFASDGPTHCSGLPVAGYDSDGLIAALGVEGELLATSHEVHTTPFGTTQPFTWIVLRRSG